ncbi:MAG TPA: DUF3467 domain-containing protein [Patescibacteria group bacterium]|nr:DUF3467 domain-containing protein [Patescibacteria group bacterium]
MSEEVRPFRPLGESLKRIREKLRQSVSEVSGAVEIDEETLISIETGSERPSEDILSLLAAHFGTRDEETTKLWELAGYSQQTQTNTINDYAGNSLPTMLVMPVDRIAYTDSANVTVNDHGVVINFMQYSGSNAQPQVIARLGMSHEHAKNVMELLHRALSPNPPKSLPAQGQRSK